VPIKDNRRQQRTTKDNRSQKKYGKNEIPGFYEANSCKWAGFGRAKNILELFDVLTYTVIDYSFSLEFCCLLGDGPRLMIC
jgi:hypothetical protein